MRGRCVDDAGAIIVDQRYRFARGIVGQAQDDDIGGVQRIAARAGVPPLLFRHGDQRQFGTPRQPVGDFDPGGAVTAVDEDVDAHALILRRAMIGCGCASASRATTSASGSFTTAIQ